MQDFFAAPGAVLGFPAADDQPVGGAGGVGEAVLGALALPVTAKADKVSRKVQKKVAKKLSNPLVLALLIALNDDGAVSLMIPVV